MIFIDFIIRTILVRSMSAVIVASVWCLDHVLMTLCVILEQKCVQCPLSLPVLHQKENVHTYSGGITRKSGGEKTSLFSIFYFLFLPIKIPWADDQKIKIWWQGDLGNWQPSCFCQCFEILRHHLVHQNSDK